MKKSRNTRQRAAIIDFLRQTCSHPTAESIYKEARRVIPNISLGTVYRNLNFLRDHGLVREIRPSDGGSSRFEGILSPHGHFHCVGCHGLMDIPLPEGLENARWPREGKISAVAAIDLHVIGSCAECTPGAGEAAP